MLGGHTDILRGSCTPDWRVSQAYEIKRDVDVRKNTVLCRYPGARGKYILDWKLETGGGAAGRSGASDAGDGQDTRRVGQ